MSKSIYVEQPNISADRLIGIHEGEFDGPLVIVLGGIHGNEPVGVLAMTELFEMIKVEPLKNKNFYFSGNLIGLRGNLQALNAKQRYIKTDLNRLFTDNQVQYVLASDKSNLRDEDFEMRELIDAVRYYTQYYQPQKLIVLDLHTTSSEDGIFSVTSEEKENETVALGMYAPVLRGILKGIDGSTIHYFNTKNIGINTTTIAFESGQHNNPMSVKYAISGIINCLRAVGCVQPVDVEKRHKNRLKERCANFPKIIKIIYKHEIQPEDRFKMNPGYVNFQKISKGESLATDAKGNVLSPYDGFILMPMYQQQGQEGFFLVEEVV
jgi:succinylglutamate desuccinylase